MVFGERSVKTAWPVAMGVNYLLTEFQHHGRGGGGSAIAMEIRSLWRVLAVAALAGVLSGCLGAGVGSGRQAASAYPNINEVPPLPTGHLMSAEEAAAETARVASLGERARVAAGGPGTAAAMGRSAAALQSKGAAQTAAARADLACRVPAGQPKPKGCP